MARRDKPTGPKQHQQGGFTLLEMLLATVIILVGLVAVAQLVPTSVMLNSNSRNDATALVFGQRVLEGMRGQPLSATFYQDPQVVPCALPNVCLLGDSDTAFGAGGQSGECHERIADNRFFGSAGSWIQLYLRGSERSAGCVV